MKPNEFEEKGFEIIWKTTRYGKSFVKARSKLEARKKADKNEDENLEEYNTDEEWFIDEIIELPKGGEN